MIRPEDGAGFETAPAGSTGAAILSVANGSHAIRGRVLISAGEAVR